MTGDLRVTIDYITHAFDDATKAPVRFPFFTVWKRARPGDPWRYVAESQGLAVYTANSHG